MRSSRSAYCGGLLTAWRVLADRRGLAAIGMDLDFGDAVVGRQDDQVPGCDDLGVSAIGFRTAKRGVRPLRWQDARHHQPLEGQQRDAGAITPAKANKATRNGTDVRLGIARPCTASANAG